MNVYKSFSGSYSSLAADVAVLFVRNTPMAVDDKTQALIDTAVTKAVAAVTKDHKAGLKTVLATIKEKVAEQVAAHKEAGANELAAAAKDLGTELHGVLKEHLTA